MGICHGLEVSARSKSSSLWERGLTTCAISYALQWLSVLPLEVIAASLTIEYWNNSLPRSVFVTIFLFVILTINMFGVKGYGEAEYIFSMVKVIAIIGFMYVLINPHAPRRACALCC